MNKKINIRVICPSSSFKEEDRKNIEIITNKLIDNNFVVTFGKNIYVKDDIYMSASIEDRISDLHDALTDSSVDIILCGKGGFNVNQILPYIDYKLLENSNKMICGMSDNTALLIAIYMKSNITTYLGPNFINLDNDDNLFNFIEMVKNSKYIININDKDIIKKGSSKGTIIGANLCTLNLLQGTEYLKKINSVILFIEDDDNYKPDAFFREFDRNLESLLHCNIFDIKAVVFGRFEDSCNVDKDKIIELIKRKKQLQNIPIIMNFDIGHTFPVITLPIGGKCIIDNNLIRICNE